MKAKLLFLRLFLYVGGLILLVVEISPVYAADLQQQRQQFKQAYQAAILNPDEARFQKLSVGLDDYPIVHYLPFFYLQSNIATVESAAIEAFLKRHQNSHLASRLRSTWLEHLGQEKKWTVFLAFYRPQKETTLQCYYLQARLAVGEVEGWVEAAKKLWLVGKSQPPVCDPVFDYLYKNNWVTDALRWQRVKLAMKDGHVSLARYLAKGLIPTSQKWANLWQAMHQNPLLALKTFDLNDSPKAREVVGYGLKRLAREDAQAAYELWQDIFKKRYAFSSTENNELLRYIVLKAVRQNLFQAANWFNDMAFMTPALYQAQLQITLAQQDWQAVINLIQTLPDSEQDEEKWHYWQARALEQIGKTELAETRYQSLAQHRHYYGFLAADRLGKSYTFHPQPSVVTSHEKIQLLQKYPALINARELYLVNLMPDAREEWQTLLSQLNLVEKKIAATLAHQWGWHYRAIATIYQAKQYDDLNIRFPMPFNKIVSTHAQKQGLNKAWVYALIRQESAFKTDAISVAGALGLMQLMPATAETTAAKHSLKFNHLDELFIPEINIQLGTAHLRDLLEIFDGNYFLVTAAYNAGASRVKQWLKRYGCLAPDIWIELIPFNETRNYTKRVLSYLPVFEFQSFKKNPQAVKPMPLAIIQGDDC